MDASHLPTTMLVDPAGHCRLVLSARAPARLDDTVNPIACVARLGICKTTVQDWSIHCPGTRDAHSWIEMRGPATKKAQKRASPPLQKA